jgi:hypothetical protein
MAATVATLLFVPAVFSLVHQNASKREGGAAGELDGPGR